MPNTDELNELKAAIERYCIAVQPQPVQLNSGGWSNYYCDGKAVTLHPRYARIIGALMGPAVHRWRLDVVPLDESQQALGHARHQESG